MEGLCFCVQHTDQSGGMTTRQQVQWSSSRRGLGEADSGVVLLCPWEQHPSQSGGMKYSHNHSTTFKQQGYGESRWEGLERHAQQMLGVHIHERPLLGWDAQ